MRTVVPIAKVDDYYLQYYHRLYAEGYARQGTQTRFYWCHVSNRGIRFPTGAKWRILQLKEESDATLRG